MPNLASLGAHTDAVIARLEAAVAASIILVGDAKVPDGSGWPEPDTPGLDGFVPYMVVYPLPASIDGHLAAADDQASLTWQITCVGATRSQAEVVADYALAALVGQTLAVTGRDIPRVVLDDAAGGVRPDETVQPTVFIATPRFRAWSTPA